MKHKIALLENIFNFKRPNFIYLIINFYLN